MGKLIKKEKIINPDTGEYKENIKYVDNLYSKRGYIFRYNQSYLKSFFDCGLPEECNLVDCGKFYRLMKYIVGENQLLGYRSETIKPLTIKKMCEIFNCEIRQTRRFIQKMKKLKIIKEVQIDNLKWYAINPLYVLKSKYLSLMTFIIFQEELKPILPSWTTNRFLSEAEEIKEKIEVKK